MQRFSRPSIAKKDKIFRVPSNTLMNRGNVKAVLTLALTLVSLLPLLSLSTLTVSESGNPAGYVKYTLVLYNNTLLPGNVAVEGEGYPSAIAYNPSNGYLYVLSLNSVFVVDPASDRVIERIPLNMAGSLEPTSIAYDPSNGYIYVAVNVSSVLVINPATKEVVSEVPVRGEIWQMVYDPSNGYIYAAVTSSNAVAVIDPSKNAVVATIGVGLNPIGMTYDPKNGYIYVADYGSGEASVINPKNNNVVANVSVGGFPWGITYDPKNGYIYVAEYNGKVAVVDPSTDKVVANISVGDGVARWVTYDPSNGLAYVTVDCYNAPNNVTVIDPSNNSIVAKIQVGYFPWGIVYDPVNGYLYVANMRSGTLSVIATPNATSNGPASGVPAGKLNSTEPADNLVAVGGQDPAADPSTSAPGLFGALALVGVVAVALVSVVLVIAKKK